MTRVTPSNGSNIAQSVDHLCREDGCSRWGAWGYDSGEGISGWWCLQHRPDHDPVRPMVEQNWISDGNEG